VSRLGRWHEYADYRAARESWLRRRTCKFASPPAGFPDAADTGVSLLDLRPAQCRYALTEESPYTFCGKPTAHRDEPYCAEHKALCHVGRASWRALERMIHGEDVTLAPETDDVERTLCVDEEFREAAAPGAVP
jgi:hypothetical protein